MTGLITTVAHYFLLLGWPAAIGGYLFGRWQGFDDCNWWWTRQCDGPPLNVHKRAFYVLSPAMMKKLGQ